MTFIPHSSTVQELVSDNSSEIGYLKVSNKNINDITIEIANEIANETINETINETANETINETANETINETVNETINKNSVTLPFDLIKKCNLQISQLAHISYVSNDIDTFKSLISHDKLDYCFISDVMIDIIQNDDCDSLEYMRIHSNKYNYAVNFIYGRFKQNFDLNPKIKDFIRQEILKIRDYVLVIEAYEDKQYEKTREIIKNGTFNKYNFNNDNEYNILARVFIDNDDVCMFSYLYEHHKYIFTKNYITSDEILYAYKKKASKIIIWMMDNNLLDY